MKHPAYKILTRNWERFLAWIVMILLQVPFGFAMWYTDKVTSPENTDWGQGAGIAFIFYFLASFKIGGWLINRIDELVFWFTTKVLK